MKFPFFHRTRKVSVGRLILLSGIATASSSVAYGAKTSGPMERSSDSYSKEAVTSDSASTRNTDPTSKNMTGFKKRKPVPVCDKLNASLECSTDAGKARALKFPETEDERISK